MQDFVNSIIARLKAEGKSTETVDVITDEFSYEEAQRALAMTEKEQMEFLCLLEEQTDEFINTVLEATKDFNYEDGMDWDDFVKQEGWNV